MNSANSIVEDYLHRLRRQFYRDPKNFFQQRRVLIQALTLPARWFDKSKLYMAEDDYRRLLDTVISGIRKHGDLATIRNFGVYFLDCMQRHIKHHGEEYLDLVKGLQAKQRQAMHQIVHGLTVIDEAAAPSTEHLAELNRLLKSAGRRPKKNAAASTQLGLFTK